MTKKYIGNKPIWVDENLLPVRHGRVFWWGVAVLCVFAATLFYPVESSQIDVRHVWKMSEVELNDSSILNQLIALGSPCPSVGLAQIKLESGNYTSKICKENKNIAGIKFNKHGFCKCENHGHAVYSTYEDCLKDFVRIQNMMLTALDKGGYAEDSTYIKKLNKWIY